MSELFAEPRKHLELIRAKQPYVNIYFSTYSVDAGWDFPRLRARQDFINQSIIPFDIDKVTWPEDKYQHSEALVRAALQGTGLNYEDCAVICSGNGVQFFFQVQQPIVDPAQYDRLKLSYVNLIKKMQQNIEPMDSTAQLDPSVWSKARIMRVPATINEKKDKPTVEAFTVKSTVTEIPMFLGEILEEYSEEPTEIPVSRMPDPDTDAILEQCDFIKWCKNNQAQVSEPQWMALLSIIGRVTDGANLAHQYSKGHPQYDSQATEEKLAHALEYGPRTCSSIGTMFDCSSCQHHQKCASPIAIRGDLFCGTKDSGFYTLVVDGDGNVKSLKPDRNGLAHHLIKNSKLKSTGDTVYQWDGEKYVALDDDNFLGKIHKMYKPLPATLATARETLDILKAHDKVSVNRNETLSTRYLNFKNGVLDKKENIFEPKTEKHFFRYCLDFNYDQNARCPKFDAFMKQVTCNDAEIEQCLLEFGGYALSGDEPWEHKALILYGLGANGKSTYLSILKLLAGQGNFSSLGIRKLAEPNTARLIEGRLFNAADETPVDAFRKYAELFKNLVAGGEIDAHKKYHDSFEFRNRAKILFSCNDVPGFSGADSGIIRRLILLPFNAHFLVGANKFIIDELKEELPGIFNKMWLSYQQAKIKKEILEPKAAKRLLEEVKYDSNPIVSFILDACEVTGNADDKVLNKDMYVAYTNYCSEMGIKNTASSVHFSRTINRLHSLHEGKITVFRTKETRGFCGIKLIKREEF